MAGGGGFPWSAPPNGWSRVPSMKQRSVVVKEPRMAITLQSHVLRCNNVIILPPAQTFVLGISDQSKPWSGTAGVTITSITKVSRSNLLKGAQTEIGGLGF